MGDNETGSAAEKLTFLLIGAGIGATLALLFAPKSGRELREDIADVTKRGFDYAGEGVRKATDSANDYYETGRKKVNELYDTARDKVSQSASSVSDVASRQKDQISAAIEAGKQAYLEEKRRSGAAVED
ncbi:MAG TPA: YtxH domain-containing protein [Blastocatellia bacterium]|nr:YtxH domain-containing protein [Blastocatellia bacterium]